ncbi:MAG TPA: hypothetical protein VFU09_12705 [Candidatus Udaeobacter sp.]|nr:hypothetical protein [Candidatus Udaeobacter sp.]
MATNGKEHHDCDHMYFGPKNVGPIYGLMLTAWSFASVFGPLYIARIER